MSYKSISKFSNPQKNQVMKSCAFPGDDQKKTVAGPDGPMSGDVRGSEIHRGDSWAQTVEEIFIGSSWYKIISYYIYII